MGASKLLEHAKAAACLLRSREHLTTVMISFIVDPSGAG